MEQKAIVLYLNPEADEADVAMLMDEFSNVLDTNLLDYAVAAHTTNRGIVSDPDTIRSY